MIAEGSTFFSMVDRVIHELALHDRKVLQRLRDMAIREADATVGNQMKEDALRAFADKAERALGEARWHGCAHEWREEYYGTRCVQCDTFYPFGGAPWDDLGEGICPA